MISSGGGGVTDTVREWGRLMLQKYNKPPAAEVLQSAYEKDTSLRYLSYWYIATRILTNSAESSPSPDPHPNPHLILTLILTVIATGRTRVLPIIMRQKTQLRVTNRR